MDTLDTIGFVSIAYPPLLRRAMHEAMESWKQFCTLPQEKKRVLSGGDRVKDFGYMRRSDKGSRADDKELFHALRAHHPLLLPKAQQIGDSRATNFIEAINVLLIEMGPFVRSFARAVERRYGIAGFENEVMRSQDYWTFRYLRYPKGNVVLAHPHADRGGFTFHLGESESGGEYLSFGKEWLPWPVSETETIIFPSMGLQYRSQCKLKALWHRVVPVESLLRERYSMVVFVDFQMSHRFDDSRFRMQEFEPGFNYQIPFREFAKLFVPRQEMVPG